MSTTDTHEERATVVVTIGHTDWQGALLPLRTQHRFTADVTAILDSVGFDPFLTATGSGLWAGNVEPSTVWAGTVEPDALDLLRHNLAAQATIYNQESIGLIIHGCTDRPSYVTAA